MALDASVIPRGHYCYTPGRVEADAAGRPIFHITLCPYWELRADEPEQDNGYCRYLKAGDWEGPGLGLLWDQVKECGVNEERDEDWA